MRSSDRILGRVEIGISSLRQTTRNSSGTVVKHCFLLFRKVKKMIFFIFFLLKKTRPLRRGSKIGIAKKIIWRGPWDPPWGPWGAQGGGGLCGCPRGGPSGGQKHSFYCSKTLIFDILAFRPPEGLRSTPVRLFRPPLPFFCFLAASKFFWVSPGPPAGGVQK